MNSIQMTTHLNQSTIEEIKAEIRAAQKEINQNNKKEGNLEEPRTQAKNITFPAKTIKEEQEFRQDVVAAQIPTWKAVIPELLKKLSRIPDPRRLKSIKHKVAVLMLVGLLMFVFKIKSLRAVNNEMGKPQLLASLQDIFPELDGMPHASTLSRFLDRIDLGHIEKAHIAMIKDLLKKKKFQKALIFGHLPLSIDGVQKVVRDGVLHDANWLERTIKIKGDAIKVQKYIYVLEANMTFQNGLTIPLMSEFLYFEGNQNQAKQDCELTAFPRLISKIKLFFKRQQIIFCLDKLYANDSVISTLEKKGWKYIIVLPGKKLKSINEALLKLKVTQAPIPGQSHYRGRKQTWSFVNNLKTKGGNNLNAISCLESWLEVDQSGKQVTQFSEHRWITNVLISFENIHLIANLCARKRWSIEDSNNTEKNRGYNYKHLYSTHWNAMRCFHLLMRLAHAINAISEFTNKLKKFIHDFGCSYILNFIKESLEHPWLKSSWLRLISSQPGKVKLLL